MPGCGWGWGYGGMSGWGAGGSILMAVFWIALIALIVWAVVRLVQSSGGRYRDRQHAETPQEILDRRFARGEIDTAAYEDARARLAEHHQGPALSSSNSH
jgi:putative membrane protein